MTILEKIKFEEDWLSEVNLTKENMKIALEGIRATVREQQPCEDCISRQAVLDILKDKWNMFSNANDAMQESIDTIEALASITPQPKMGRWTRRAYWSAGVGMGESYGYYYQCSECKEITQGGYIKCDSKYCTNCGAKMVEP